MNIGQKIKYMRRQRGWSQVELACCMGKSVPSISKIELGHTDVRLSCMENIATAFQLPLTEILSCHYDCNKETADADMLRLLNEKLAKYEACISALRLKLVELYEELQIHEKMPA